MRSINRSCKGSHPENTAGSDCTVSPDLAFILEEPFFTLDFTRIAHVSLFHSVVIPVTYQESKILTSTMLVSLIMLAFSMTRSINQ